YLSIREEFDLSTESGAIAFTDPYGKKLAIDTFKEYFLNSKRERLSMEFNSTFCQGILQTRYKDIEANKNLLIDEMMNDLPRETYNYSYIKIILYRSVYFMMKAWRV